MRFYKADQIRNVTAGDPHLAVAVAVAIQTIAAKDKDAGIDPDLAFAVAADLAVDAGIVGAGITRTGMDLVHFSGVTYGIPEDRISDTLATLANVPASDLN